MSDEKKQKRKVRQVLTVFLAEDGNVLITGDEIILGDLMKSNLLMSKVFNAMANMCYQKRSRIVKPNLTVH